MTPRLFTPFDLAGLTLPNRIVVSPMCQYSATDGLASDWHQMHLGSLSVSGAGLLMIEATAVEARGRITDECLGLWSDASEHALGDVITRLRSYSTIPIGIQLSHAGRKGSTTRVGEPGSRGQLPPDRAWETIAPSPVPFQEGRSTPVAMTRREMEEVIAAFVASAQRCARIGIDLIELHAAHGYLLSAFLSPLANQREDSYGGSLENRMRFPLEVIAAVRKVWPRPKPLGVRINGTDWVEGGITIDEAAVFATRAADLGCDFIDVSSGGNASAKIQLVPGYQVPLARKVRDACKLPVIAVGLIREPALAEQVLADADADLIAIGRGFLHNPRWPWHAAEALGVKLAVPYQYERGATSTGLPSADTKGR